jgi:type VI secretion system protein ImpH
MRTILDHLTAEPYDFDFFAAVRVLLAEYRDRQPVGREAPPVIEVARFRGHPSLAFQQSHLLRYDPPTPARPPRLEVTFLGLYGTNGVLPTHYTQAVIPTVLDDADVERQALRDWLDLFNHRFLSLFYRAWEKYRFYLPFERGEHRRAAADPFTAAIRSLMGFGTRGLTGRLVVRGGVRPDAGYQWGGTTADRGEAAPDPTALARIDDAALLRYAGLFVQRPRNAANLHLLLEDYFRLPIRVEPFRGQWLAVPDGDKPRLGLQGQLGVDTVIGDRVWDVQSRFRLVVGPLRYDTFTDLLPDRTPIAARKTLFLVSQLTRTFVGPDLDFEVQLLLAAAEVPPAELTPTGLGPRLGWNVWLISDAPPAPVGDAVFEGEWVTGV